MILDAHRVADTLLEDVDGTPFHVTDLTPFVPLNPVNRLSYEDGEGIEQVLMADLVRCLVWTVDIIHAADGFDRVLCSRREGDELLDQNSGANQTLGGGS